MMLYRVFFAYTPLLALDEALNFVKVNLIIIFKLITDG